MPNENNIVSTFVETLRLVATCSTLPIQACSYGFTLLPTLCHDISGWLQS